MRHRLYYLLPDLDNARKANDALLLSRIEQRHIHFLTNGISLPSDMPEANVLQKTDLVHGAESGMITGALLGLVVGLWLAYVSFADTGSPAGIVLLTTIGGLIFGAWAASMVAAGMPNSRLKKFEAALQQGKILMIVDVPAGRVREIEDMMAARHPETDFGGEDSHIPVFP